MFALFFVFLLFFSSSSFADVPVPWQIGFQQPATEWMLRVSHMHSTLMFIMLGLIILIALVLFYACFKFNAKRNPIPNRFSHNSFIEIVWTGIPVLIILFIAYPSINLLRFEQTVPESEITLKVTGHQWHWSYEYPDLNSFSFVSRIKNDLAKGEHRLLEVDNRVVVPVDTNVKVLVTSADVIHSWGIPSFGIKQDAIPGRLSETWFNVKKEGVYYGQCFELCGRLHGFMPIVVEVVSKEKFRDWAKNLAQK